MCCIDWSWQQIFVLFPGGHILNWESWVLYWDTANIVCCENIQYTIKVQAIPYLLPLWVNQSNAQVQCPLSLLVRVFVASSTAYSKLSAVLNTVRCSKYIDRLLSKLPHKLCFHSIRSQYKLTTHLSFRLCNCVTLHAHHVYLVYTLIFIASYQSWDSSSCYCWLLDWLEHGWNVLRQILRRDTVWGQAHVVLYSCPLDEMTPNESITLTCI